MKRSVSAAQMCALTLGLVCSRASAEPYRVVLEDPRNDDDGPGSYIYPSDTEFRPGSFDLRQLEVVREGDTVVFRVTMDAQFQRPPVAKRTNASEIPLENDIYVQNIDIYIDTNPAEGAGRTDTVPGRHVTIDSDGAWDVAVIMTPLPFQVKSIIEDWPGAKQTRVPNNLRALGPRIEARIPVLDLGGPPEPHWGYQVMVSGALWEQNFNAIQRIAGSHFTNALTMPVVTVAERRAFGGGELTWYHPWVVDILTPPGKSQERILGASSAEAERLASVPMVYPDREAFERARKKAGAVTLTLEAKKPDAPPPGVVELTVRDVQGDIVVLEKGERDVKQFHLGTVLDDEGEAVGRVVVTSVYPKFVLATAVDGAENIRPGARVRFAGDKE